jgi:hypothetical protein
VFTSNSAFAVTPVVDYEPPPSGVRQCRPTIPTRRRNTSAPQRNSSKQSAPATSPAVRQAAVFADAALRRVLEVIDRRRPAAQLRGLLAAGLVDSVLSANRTASRDGAAVLRRLRLQPLGPVDRLAAAEVFGTYSRGRRIRAIACRVEPVGTNRWQLVALHIG